jgi:hypothetical protein
VILAKELVRVLHPPDGWDLSTKLDKAHARVDGINDKRATEAQRLSQQVVIIFGVLVDLGMQLI